VDLILYEKDCETIDLTRPRLEMLKKEPFNIAILVDRVLLILDNKNVLELKNRLGVRNYNIILKD
jgi:hypothetical protein